MKRKIYNDLLNWKNKKDNKKPLMILGVRQCGKTHIIKEFCQNEFTNFKEVNLFKDIEVVDIYKQNISSDKKYELLKIKLNFDLEKEDSILFIDEIQECEELISDLKYFCENHNNVKIICAGSLLGVKLNRMKKSYPVGKVDRLYLYPMDFEEFLMAYNEYMLIDYIKKCYKNNEAMGTVIHQKAMDYYKIYLITGGMPESVKNMVKCQNRYIEYDTNILHTIINDYKDDMNKHVSNSAETLKISSIYNSLPSQLMNASKKFQYSNINKGAKSREYYVPLNWLEQSNLIQICKLVKNPEIPLLGFVDENTFKAYLSDVGILNNLVGLSIKNILMDEAKIYKGIITENYVANQLKANGIPLLYWKGSRNSEVDFLISNELDGIIPIEVKSSDSTQSKSLKTYMELFKPKYAIRISSKDFGYNPKTKIKSIPLYAAFLIK